MIRDYYTETKTLFALAAAWGFGLWSGISWTAQVAPTTYSPIEQPPAWVATAESMAESAVAVVGLAAIAWIFLDWRYGGEEE